jgi:uncharacterized membrane protein
MTLFLWLAQVLLALAFLAAGAMHALRYEQAKRQMPWVSALPEGQVRVIGFLEMLGAVGLILPAVTGVLPWLTPLAAVGLALVMTFAIAFHLTRSERRNAVANGLLLALAVFVAVGRYMVAPL